MVDIGKLIRNRRKELGFSAEKLAGLVMGSRASVDAWERNKMTPADDTLLALGKALDLDGDTLIAFKYLNKLVVAGVDLKTIARPEVLIRYGARIEGLGTPQSEEAMIAGKLATERRWFDLIRFGADMAEDRRYPARKIRDRALGVNSPFVLNEPQSNYGPASDPPDPEADNADPKKRTTRKKSR